MMLSLFITGRVNAVWTDKFFSDLKITAYALRWNEECNEDLGSGETD
jgi:hypothetical protein